MAREDVVSGLGEVNRRLLGDGHRAVLTTRASNAHRQTALALPHVSGHDCVEQCVPALEECLRLRVLDDEVANQRIAPSEGRMSGFQ